MKKILLLIFLLPLLTFAQNTWTQKLDLPATARYSSVGFSIDDYGYILGGNKTGGIYTNELWQYNQASNSWIQKANFPLNIFSPSVFVINNEAYVGNGNLPGGPPSNNFYKYTPSSNTWTAVASFPGTARYGSAFFAIGNKGYICAGGYLNDLWEYNSTSNTWLQKANLPGIARKGTTGFALNGKGYITTGKSSSSAYLKDTWEYNPTSNSWTQKGDMSAVGRSVATTFVVNNTAYCSTGHSGSGSSVDDLWKYNAATGNWTFVNNIDATSSDEIRHGASSFVINGKAYIATGINTGGTRKDDLWEFGPELNYSSDTIQFTACNEYTSPSSIYTWDSSGFYLDTLANADINGNDSIISIDLTVNHIDNGVSQISNLLQADQSGISYQWLDCNELSLIPNDTNQTFTPSYSGDFAVIVTNGECIDTSACIPMKSVGISSLESNQFIVYPNPFKNEISIENFDHNSEVRIMDLLGREIHFEQLDNIISIHSKPGIYLLQVETKNKQNTIIKIQKL